MTLAIYLAFLMSTGENSVYLPDVLRDYAQIEALLAYANVNTPYVISAAAIAEIRQGRKIGAIKVVRAEHPETLAGRTLGLKQAKDIVDAYVAAHPESYNTYHY